jgi:hypothetical protein
MSCPTDSSQTIFIIIIASLAAVFVITLFYAFKTRQKRSQTPSSIDNLPSMESGQTPFKDTPSTVELQPNIIADSTTSTLSPQQESDTKSAEIPLESPSRYFPLTKLSITPSTFTATCPQSPYTNQPCLIQCFPMQDEHTLADGMAQASKMLAFKPLAVPILRLSGVLSGHLTNEQKDLISQHRCWSQSQLNRTMLWLVFEDCGRPLDEVLSEEWVNDDFVLNWMIQLADGLHALAERGIVHGNIWMNNIFVLEPEEKKAEVRLGGVAIGTEDHQFDKEAKEMKGTEGREEPLAPDIRAGGEPSCASDAFSLVRVFERMIQGRFRGDSDRGNGQVQNLVQRMLGKTAAEIRLLFSKFVKVPCYFFSIFLFW